METRRLNVVDLGLLRYEEARIIQENRVEQVRDGADETLFLVEHPAVVTLGRKGGLDNLLTEASILAERGVEVVQSSRGGDITCHYPGQLVAYPIFRIERRPGGLKCFFRDLEEAVIATVARFGVSAGRVEGRTGVWVGNRKICAMGLAVRRWVTWHGLSLNVGADLGLFSNITACGLADARVTSLVLETGDHTINIPRVKEVFVVEFRKILAPAALVEG